MEKTANILADSRFQSFIKVEKNCQTAMIGFPEPMRSTNRELIAIFLQELLPREKVKSFTFLLHNQEGEIFDFTIENSGNARFSAAKNGTLTVYLAKREVERLMSLSGQTDNKAAHRVATYGFYPGELDDFNHTIFYLQDLQNCIIEIRET